jgi:hypothetical protein
MNDTNHHVRDQDGDEFMHYKELFSTNKSSITGCIRLKTVFRLGDRRYKNPKGAKIPSVRIHAVSL